jgi:sulfur-carrier protein
MKSVRIRFFALFREQAGIEQESVTVDCQTYSELYTWAAEKYGFTLPAEMIQLAVNDEFAPLDQKIQEGSQVVFIPPVAGG